MSKERRGLFEIIFGPRPKPPATATQLKMLNGYTPVFTSFGQNAYASDVVRAAIHSIASNAAKLKPKHVRRVEGQVSYVNSSVERLLQVRPNEFMNSYDFLYKVITQLYMKNNAFIFMMTDGVDVTGFYPVNASAVELLETPSGEIYAKFQFMGGRQAILPYSEIIHLRRFYFENDMYGESNEQALLPTLELINTTNQGIINAVKSSANLRGLLKFTQTMLKPEDLKRARNEFVSEYMTVSNDGGVAALDAKADYQELKSEPRLVNHAQMKVIEEKVYKYFGVNESIVMSKYNEDEWNAFYESVIEPLAVQLSLEFTSKLFTDRERGHGNEIIFEANRLQYASVKTKINLIEKLMDRGLLSLNEAREIFNLSPIEDGDRRIVSLNYVNADKADLYQLGKDGESDDEDGDDNGNKGDQASGAKGN